MKRLACIFCLFASFSAHALTNTNFTVSAKAVMVATNGVLSAPSNFLSTNDIVVGADVDVALSNTWGWVSSTRTVIVNTNFFQRAEADSNFVARSSFAVADTNVASFWNPTNQTLYVNTNILTGGYTSTNLVITNGIILSVSNGLIKQVNGSP